MIVHPHEASSVEEYKMIFNSIPIPIWRSDFTRVYRWLLSTYDIYKEGLKDYLLTNKMEVVEVLDINPPECNEAMIKFWGYKNKKQVLENYCRIMKSYVSCAYDLIVKEYITIAQGKMTGRHKWSMIMPNGKRKWIISSFRLLEIGDGTVQWVEFYLDITKETYLQERLSRALLNERKSKTLLEKEMGFRGSYITEVAHDLKNCVTPILLTSETLYNNLSDTEYKNVAGNLKDATVRLNKRISGLADLVRSEAGSLKIELMPIDIGEIVRGVSQLYEQSMHNRRGRFDISIPDELPLVMGNEDRLVSVVENLIDNAFKYSGEGSDIMVKVSKLKNFIKVSVADDGPGVSAELRDKLFSKKIVTNNSDLYSGFGIGLALSNAIVKKHNGSVRYHQSKKGINVFSFRIPIYEKEGAV